ncbi:hypothetical protein MPH_09412 [Macrophomina phaseolina MS6]|uniref:Uncharacterized protein n=1 Tax=Macrophomina phaseolina (strain MS6) TaxID=1126212 RepID=K2QUE5_MACPH|nr:hypothetical protein MPH_09412 [Macrophomina phaseolina MS6]
MLGWNPFLGTVEADLCSCLTRSCHHVKLYRRVGVSCPKYMWSKRRCRSCCRVPIVSPSSSRSSSVIAASAVMRKAVKGKKYIVLPDGAQNDRGTFST